jgi:hypothetical protein
MTQNQAFVPLGSLSRLSTSNEMMPPRTEATIAGTLSYHFLNDELRVQEGVQERSIEQFLAEGWYMAASGRSL